MIKKVALTLGQLATNCYLVWGEEDKKCIIIDPADEAVAICDEIETRGLTPVAILASHCHFDHVLAVMELKLIYKIPFCASRKDEFLIKKMESSANYWLGNKQDLVKIDKIDVDLDNKGEIRFGEIKMKVIKTPGHTPGGLCFYLPAENWLFSGDAWFAGAVGRTDLSYSSKSDLMESIEKLKGLPKGTEVLAGHGDSFRS